MKKFDIAVLGGGPGGYPAAIKAAQLGKSVALIEMKDLGGTCLNRGCIPSKALIANAQVLKGIKEASKWGIEVGSLNFDYANWVERKDKVVEGIRNSLTGLIKANKITLFRGQGKLTGPKTLKVLGQDGGEIFAENIILATGSEPRNMLEFPCDYETIHDSTSLLELKTLPRSLAIIGGGVIGCEFASLYSTLGVVVTIIELLERILPMEAKNISDTLTEIFKKRGLKIETGSVVKEIKKKKGGLKVVLESGKTIETEMALVAVGRKLNTSDIGLREAGVLLQENGTIATNDKMETNVPGIYAVGDIASQWWLAHVATHQGIVAASNAAGISAHIHYNAIPNVIFTDPEIGSVGLTLEQALEKGFKAGLGAFPFQALGKAQATQNTEGFAQIVIDKKTNQILGAQVIGHDASLLVAEMALAITNELTLESITETMHAHPTLAESWLEASYLSLETPLHLPPKRKS